MNVRRSIAALAVVAMTALALAGCAFSTDEKASDTSLTVAWNKPFYSYNPDSATGNNVANGILAHLTRSQFFYYDRSSKLVRNTDFGTYKKLSDNPLTVRYTIDKGVTWSDGTPVDAADMLLSWVANSGVYNNSSVSVKVDATGKITNQEALDKVVFFNAAGIGAGLSSVTKVPKIGDDGRSITMVYDTPDVDWQTNFIMGLPAHEVVEKAFGSVGTASEAKKKLIDAIQTKDVDVLRAVSTAWNTGFDLPDKLSVSKPTKTTKATPTKKAGRFLSDGAYILTGFEKGRSATLTVNPRYDWGSKPKIDKLTVRFIQDPMAAVGALQNGDVDIIQPEPSKQVLKGLQKLDGVTVRSGSESTYEHLDLTFNNLGPFDPASYGGDSAKAQLVRQAFLKTVPRQKIVDELVKPLNPDAAVANSLTLLPTAPGYKTMVGANGSSAYGDVDIAGAKKLLASAGVTAPVSVKFMYDPNDARRTKEFHLIADSAKKAGFELVDVGTADWSSMLGSGTYDAVVFGWQNTDRSVTQTRATFTRTGGNNLNGFDDPKVDALYKQLAQTLDTSKQLGLLEQIEKQLWTSAYGLPLFQYPQVTAWDDSLKHVSSLVLAPTYFWNFWSWRVER